MAISLPALLEGIQIAWDIITSTYEPLNAGETFTARPFAYVEGVYNYTNQNNVTFYNQPAYLKYDDGELFVFGSGEGSFSISTSSGLFSVGGNSYGSYYFTSFSIKSPDFFRLDRPNGYKNTYGEMQTFRISSKYNNHSLNIPTFKYSDDVPNVGMIAFAVDTGIGNITSTGFNALISDVVPIAPGITYTYYEALDTYINYFNDKYEDLNLTIDDFPSESDYLPEQPTTDSVGNCGCNIDYNEIMSPSEFNDVLNSAEYDLEEIPTTFAFDLPELPDETLPEGMLSLAGNVANASYNYYDALGLSSTLIAVGVIVCVIRLLRGGR